MPFMERMINRPVIDLWIDKNGPNGLLRLAEKSGVSASTIEKARIGKIPKRQRTRDALCAALNVSERTLFPPLARSGERAS